LPTNTAVIKATASDADGTVVSYSWVKISGPAATLSNTSTATLTINNLVAGNYTFRITVTDDKGSTDNDDVNVQVIIETTNQAPVADAGADIQINLPTNAVSITGKGTDVDGSIVAYQWTKISGPAVTVQNISTSTILLTSLEEGDYTFRLTVTDNSGDTGSDDVTINVASQTVNKAPTANAGIDLTVYLPDNSVEISGSGSDLDGTVTSYLWEKTSGGFVTMAGSATSTLNVSGMLEGNYEFSLTITDDDGATGTDYVRVTVYALAANKPPTVDLGNNLIKYMPLDSISIVAKASDPDGQIVQYTWRKLSGGTLLIQPTDSLLVLKDFAPGSYTIRLTVTDNNGETASDDISITIISASTNRNPVGDAGIDLYVNLPQDTISVFGSASDPDNDNLTLVWTKLTGPVVTMTGINSPTLSLSDLKVGTYKFEITVTDSKDASASDQMYLQVFEAPAENLVPIADAGDDVILNIPFTDYQHVGSGLDQDGLIISYEWRMIDGPVIDNTVIYSDTLTLTGLVAGEYTYEFIVTDNESAIATDELTVKVFSEELSDIGAHKVFSPDGNGIDDLWIIDNLDKVAGCPVTIFNRFGLKVYESNNYLNDWDGMYNGNPLPDADYYFIISCENSKNTTSGGIRIIRDY
jgi:gliding motility-associated-like protein